MNTPAVVGNLDTITAEILILKRQTLGNLLEIGRRLIQAKQLVGHGNWGRYLETRVEFSERTANRFMRAAESLGNSPTLADLEPSKAFLLLEAPEEERQSLAERAPDMTAREIQEAVREANRAKKEAEDANREAAELGRRLEKAIQRAEAAEAKPPQVVEKIVTKTVYQDSPETRATMERMARDLADKNRTLEQREADLAKAKKWLDETNKDLHKLREQVDKDYTLDERIREKEARAKELEGLIGQMEANFEDGQRNKRGGAELMRTLFPLERVLWGIARDVNDLRKEGVGGPMDDSEVAKIRNKLKELANDLDAILRDRKTIAVTAEVEVLSRE